MQPRAAEGRWFLAQTQARAVRYNSYRRNNSLQLVWGERGKKRTCLSLITNLLLSLSSLAIPAPHPLIK